MPEQSRREASLLSGIGVQVAVIVLLALAFSQAGRKLQVQQELYLKLKEQLASAQTKVEKQGSFNLPVLEKEIETLTAVLVRPEDLAGWAKRIEGLARSPFGFRDLQVRVGPPEKKIRLPISGKEGSEIRMIPLILEATTTTRNGAAFMKALRSPGLKLLCPLGRMELKALDSGAANPVEIRLTWWVAVSSAGRGSSAEAREPSGWPPPKPDLEWGIRQEPFESPLFNPSALRAPAAWRQRFKLSGILMERPVLSRGEGAPAAEPGVEPSAASVPTCVINGTVLKAGDIIEGYRVVLIAEKAVLLQKGPEEILLTS